MLFRYKKRVAFAKANKDRVMSIIIDGMDQNHCNLPHLGNQSSFENPLKQHITGVKNHSRNTLSVYRTFGTVMKGANLTIHCILSELEQWRRNKGSYPEELYIQVDGGSENANRYVLGLCELLVARNLVRLVLYTRLPTGHTHEDIDGCFGVIWSHFRKHPCLTLEAYERVLHKCFKNESLSVNVEDVYAVVDYAAILAPHIDKCLSRLHKEDQTQHQWRFESVERSPVFPFGCKTTYRAFSSDRVVELVKRPKDACISEIGKLTGLEPITTLCRWYPYDIRVDAREIGLEPEAKIEGMFLLGSLPTLDFANRSGNFKIPVMRLPEGCGKDLKKIVEDVCRKFKGGDTENDHVRNSWIDWGNRYVPISSDAQEYVLQLFKTKHPMRLPSQDLFEDNFKRVSWERKSYRTLITPTFEWPAMMQVAMDSVATRFNPNPPNPRFLVQAADQPLSERLTAFRAEMAPYYAVLASNKDAAYLKGSVLRKVTFDAEIHATSNGTYKAKHYF